MKIYNYPIWGKLFLSFFFCEGGIVVITDFFVYQKEFYCFGFGLFVSLIGLLIMSFSAHIVTSEEEIGSFLLGLCVKKCRWEKIESVATWKDSLGEFNTLLATGSLKNEDSDISELNFKHSFFRKEIRFDSSLNGYKELFKEIKKRAINAKFDEQTSNLINNKQRFAITFNNFAKVGVFIEVGLFLYLIFKILKIA